MWPIVTESVVSLVGAPHCFDPYIPDLTLRSLLIWLADPVLFRFLSFTAPFLPLCPRFSWFNYIWENISLYQWGNLRPTFRIHFRMNLPCFVHYFRVSHASQNLLWVQRRAEVFSLFTLTYCSSNSEKWLERHSQCLFYDPSWIGRCICKFFHFTPRPERLAKIRDLRVHWL